MAKAAQATPEGYHRVTPSLVARGAVAAIDFSAMAAMKQS